MQTLKEIAQQARFQAMLPSAVAARSRPSVATIRAQDLSLVLGSVKLRNYTNGRTCRLCALSESPVIQLTCRDRRSSREDAAKWGTTQCRVSPIQRGDIGRLYERVNREHGRREVVKTWGVGIRALQAEPLYILDGGSDA